MEIRPEPFRRDTAQMGLIEKGELYDREQNEVRRAAELAIREYKRKRAEISTQLFYTFAQEADAEAAADKAVTYAETLLKRLDKDDFL